jgi:uncharacterized Fe-S cluster-containing radical SAM superfamily protein
MNHADGVKLYDPLVRAEELRAVVLRGDQRRYYRLGRPGRWYGGISSADCCGCPLNCVFCWSDRPRNHPESGKLASPDLVAQKLISCAQQHHYRQVRVSGNEPTLGKRHLLVLIGLISDAGLDFILETNGILIDEEYARDLAPYTNLHVRVSLKGANADTFSRLTGAIPEGFDLALDALAHLVNSNVSCHAAVMGSFDPPEKLHGLVLRLSEIHPSLGQQLEREEIILYPHVARRLKAADITVYR